MVKETLKRRLRYTAALFLIIFIVPLCKWDKTVSGASSENVFAGKELVCAIDLGDDMYGNHGLETGFNYELLGEFAKDNDCKITIKAFRKETSWIDSLKTGSVDFVITHEHDIKNKEDIQLSRKVDDCSIWVLNKGNDPMVRQINSWISHITSSPEFPAIKNKYKGVFNPHKRVERGVITKTISPYDEIIRKQAGSLGWDWRMLAAIVYQESKFSINSTSFRGAQGLMQIMPSTAEYYGVKDLLDPSQNIEAGTSHLKRLQRMWAKEGIEGLELVKFTLASYNAGEGRIADCISLAKSKGLDGKTWNEIVEVIPLMREDAILEEPSVKYGKFYGHETIAYVDSILSHYDAFCRICPSI